MGPFVVIAAQAPAVGDEPLPEIESKLRSLDIFSAWRLLPDVQVGIVHVNSDQKLGVIVALMSRTTTARVGVSGAFRDLRDTPQALHVARMMLRGPTDSASSVAVFDGSIVATAAVSAPEVMVKTVGAALDYFDDLSDEEQADAVRNISGVAEQRRLGKRRPLTDCSATPTRCVTDCAGSRRGPVDLCPGQGMSPNYV